MNNSVPDADVDMKFEIVVIPVSDVDRAKEFYARLGRADPPRRSHDQRSQP